MSFSDICTGCGRPVFLFAREKYHGLISEIAEKHSVKVEHILSPSREQHHVAARYECYFVLHSLGLSSSQIGKVMRRDHSTVLHGIRQYKDRQYRLDRLLKERGAASSHAAQPAQWRGRRTRHAEL